MQAQGNNALLQTLIKNLEAVLTTSHTYLKKWRCGEIREIRQFAQDPR